MNHNNLYYLFLEDQQKNPMDQSASDRIRKNIENYYKEIKPPWKANLPNSIKEISSLNKCKGEEA